MRINHNISAMITQSALGNADNSMGKSLEKLSTGLRVNRASDDAAGLAVSERLRAQVRGLGRAKMNAQDGIALLQIAEGALNEMDSILQRQRELAVQAASDTLTSADRSYLNVEYGQLNQEIDRIASSTQYNGMNLLNGTGFGAAGGSVLHIGANSGDSDKITIGITTISSGSLGVSSSTAGVTAQGSANSTIGTIDTAMGTVNSL